MNWNTARTIEHEARYFAMQIFALSIVLTPVFRMFDIPPLWGMVPAFFVGGGNMLRWLQVYAPHNPGQEGMD